MFTTLATTNIELEEPIGTGLGPPADDLTTGMKVSRDHGRKSYTSGAVLEPGMRGPGPGYAAWLDRLARAGAPARLSIAAGDRLSVDEIAMRVLWPIRGQVPAEPPDRHRHQQRVGRAARHHRGAPVPAGR